MGVKISKTYKNCKIGHAIVTGTTAATNIAVAGIKTTDELIKAVEHDATSALPTDRLSECSITSDGNIQFSTTDTSTDTIDLMWISSDMG